jgi:hypothetical protein
LNEYQTLPTGGEVVAESARFRTERRSAWVNVQRALSTALLRDIGSYVGGVHSALRCVYARCTRCQQPIEAYSDHPQNIRVAAFKWFTTRF